MENIWKAKDAKANFSQIVEDALKKGPQFVTRRGTKEAVIVSVEDYEKLISKKPSFRDFLLNCPKMENGFEIKRQKDLPRNIEL